MNDLYEKNGDREERSLQETRMFKEEMNIAEYPITLQCRKSPYGCE